jgi:RanGTP-binding protein
MDVFLGKVTQQAMNYAIRSGVTLTATYAIRESAKLLKNAPQSNIRDELVALQHRLQSKIRIISPAIDMIELIAARGNTSLESAISLTKELRIEIQALGQRLASAAASHESAKDARLSSQARTKNEIELKLIVADIKKLLERIEDAVPLINLAITTSGARLSTKLPSTVSPSRLLQASTFLTAGDTRYSLAPTQAIQVGPTFTLSVYMLFAGYDRPQNEEDLRETTWKEVIHKARVKLRRVPMDVVVGTGSGSETMPSAEISSIGDVKSNNHIPAEARADEFAYQLMIIEDFDDDRVHDFGDSEAVPGQFDDVKLAGIREMIPIHEISKIFYADTSKVLNIGTDAEINHPVLLLKRDLNAVLPRRMLDREVQDDKSALDGDPEQAEKDEDQQYVDNNHAGGNRDPWRLPPSLDPEWIAFEVYTESEDTDDESERESDIMPSEDSQLENPMLKLQLNNTSQQSLHSLRLQTQPPPWANAIQTSLSLLELLLRLTSLQQFQQQPHLSITDELLNFFLEESATTGAGGDEAHRQALRADARRRVGWDPYDESPLKRRGEDYQYYTSTPSPRHNGGIQESGAWSPSGFQTRLMTGEQDQQSPSTNGSPKIGRFKRQEQRKSSPLRPHASHVDEGLGTSPRTRPE